MRVLLWTSAYPPQRGGVETMTEGLAAGLTDRGHDVTVITDSGSAGEVHDDCRPAVHRLPFGDALASRDPDRVAGVLGAIRTVTARARPEVVNVHGLHPAWFFLLRAHGGDVPLVATSHGWSAVGVGPSSIAGRVLRRANRIVCCSEFVTHAGRRLLPDVADRMTTLLNGVRPFETEAADAGLRHDGPEPVVFASRFEPDKGVTDLLAACERLAPTLPEIRVTLVGSGSLEAEVRARTAREPLAGIVTVRGPLAPDAVRRHMAGAAVVVVPSRLGRPPETSEPFGLVAAEAAALGRPVVATRVGGLPEIVVDGETGVLVEPGDPVRLADTIAGLLADPARRRRLGESARRYAAHRFDWGRHVDAYEQLYREVLTEP